MKKSALHVKIHNYKALRIADRWLVYKVFIILLILTRSAPLFSHELAFIINATLLKVNAILLFFQKIFFDCFFFLPQRDSIYSNTRKFR